MSQWIELPAQPHDSLDWSAQITFAENAVQEGKRLLWKLSLGLEAPFYPLEDELRFQALSLALQQFSKDLWPRFQQQTDHVCLYQGTAHFLDLFSWTHTQQDNLKQWLEEHRGADTEQTRRLFCAEAFALYFQMLSHRLPDEASVLLLFDLEGFSAASDALQVISKERFAHFRIALRGMEFPLNGLWWKGAELYTRSVQAPTGIVFPSNGPGAWMKAFDDLLQKTDSSSAQILFEDFLSDDWEGIERLLVIEGSLSGQGERKLKGFAAAGGEVVYV